MNHFCKYLCLTPAIFSIFSSQGFSNERTFDQAGVVDLNQLPGTNNCFPADSYRKADPATTAAGIFLISSNGFHPVALLGNPTFEQGLCTLGGGRR